MALFCVSKVSTRKGSKENHEIIIMTIITVMGKEMSKQRKEVHSFKHSETINIIVKIKPHMNAFLKRSTLFVFWRRYHFALNGPISVIIHFEPAMHIHVLSNLLKTVLSH